MSKNKRFFSILISFSIILSANLYASSFFSGYAGGKLNYAANPEAENYDPDLKLQAFFAGQFNFTQDVCSHLEFSIDTGDFLNESFFHQTESLFQIDELSFISRAKIEDCTNYFSVFMGTYDPIGSDVFLQRYFAMPPIASKITDSYLGLAGSILYPHFGAGIADIIKVNTTPIAFGGYLYFNHEDAKYFVFNTDLRFACSYRYFTCDFAAGLGFPLSNKYQGEDVIVAIDKVYWHAGTTMLFGNNYTTSLFLQAGIYNASFTPRTNNTIVSPSDIYLLFEPRFLSGAAHFNISVFSLPPNTVEKLLFIDDTLGIDLNIYSESTTIGTNTFKLGNHICFSLKNKTFMDFADYENLLGNGYNINIAPYISTNLLSGELHLEAKLRIMDFVNEKIPNGISFDIGYRTSF